MDRGWAQFPATEPQGQYPWQWSNGETVQITCTSVRNPRWANSEHTAISCAVKFDHMKQEALFTATPTDPEPYGREIFARAAAGEFGLVAEAEPPRSSSLHASPTSSVRTMPARSKTHAAR